LREFWGRNGDFSGRKREALFEKVRIFEDF
jgi:hypothetical protein